VSTGDAAEPEMLSATEGLDEDELRLDPLEEGIEPAERLSAASRFGTTPAELREGETLDQRLSEEQPDDQPVDVPDRPFAATPAEELDATIDDAPADVEPVAAEGVTHGRHADMDPGEHADEAGGSVADSLRTPAEPDDT
jgi:hypothetical protein